MNRAFYVYEHWRPDTDVCFYVGKGQGRRAYWFDRPGHHGNVLRKLARLGLAAEVRIVAGGLLEVEAFNLERERIAFWRSAGVRLANKTDGGEGVAGLKWSRKSREKFSAIKRGTIVSDDTRNKMSVAQRKRGPRKPLSLEARAQISAALKGRPLPSEVCAKMSASRRGRKMTIEQIEQRRLTLLKRNAQRNRSEA